MHAYVLPCAQFGSEIGLHVVDEHHVVHLGQPKDKADQALGVVVLVVVDVGHDLLALVVE